MYQAGGKGFKLTKKKNLQNSSEYWNLQIFEDIQNGTSNSREKYICFRES